jgi:hypothetical protein
MKRFRINWDLIKDIIFGIFTVGVWFLLRPYLPDISWNLIWPLAIVAVGGLILITAARRSS